MKGKRITALARVVRKSGETFNWRSTWAQLLTSNSDDAVKKTIHEFLHKPVVLGDKSK